MVKNVNLCIPRYKSSLNAKENLKSVISLWLYKKTQDFKYGYPFLDSFVLKNDFFVNLESFCTTTKRLVKKIKFLLNDPWPEKIIRLYYSENLSSYQSSAQACHNLFLWSVPVVCIKLQIPFTIEKILRKMCTVLLLVTEGWYCKQ